MSSAQQSKLKISWGLFVLSLAFGVLAVTQSALMPALTFIAVILYISAFSEVKAAVLAFPPLFSVITAAKFGGWPYLTLPLLFWGTGVALGVAQRKRVSLNTALGAAAYAFALLNIGLFAGAVRSAMGALTPQTIEAYIMSRINEAIGSIVNSPAIKAADPALISQLQGIENTFKAAIPLLPASVAMMGFVFALILYLFCRALMKSLGLGRGALEPLGTFKLGRISALFFVAAMILGYLQSSGMFFYLMLNFAMILMLPFVLQGFITLDYMLRKRLSAVARAVIYILVIFSSLSPLFNLLIVVMGLGVIDSFSNFRERFK